MENNNNFPRFDEDGRIIIPKSELIRKEKISKEKKIIKNNKKIIEIWEDLDFNCEDFFKNMSFIGDIKGRRNRYYLYKKDKFLIISTGFSDEKLTRMNIFLLEDILFLKDFIINSYKKNNLIGAPISNIKDYLKKAYEEIPPENKRLKHITKLNIHEIDEKNYLYSFILYSFYILSILFPETFYLSKEKRKFALMLGSNYLKNSKDIYKELKIIGYDRKRIVFERDNFYLVFSFNKPFRGVVYIYDKREIEYFNKIINYESFLGEDLFKNKIEIDCIEILNDINIKQNNICLVCYREIMAKNERNKREVMQYTDSRLKLGLKIINLINGSVFREKDGRKYRYFKKK